jgi:hypothetical protein
VDEMAANIETLLRGDLKMMSETARRKCEASYSWDKTFRRLFDLYETTHRGGRTLPKPAPETVDVHSRTRPTRITP